MKRKIYIFCLVTFSFCNAQNNNTLISEKEIVQLMNKQINQVEKKKQKRIKLISKHISWLWSDQLQDDTPISALSVYCNSIYPDQSDFEEINQNIKIPKFFKSQIEKNKEHYWSSNEIVARIKKKPKNKYYAYSIPLFNDTMTLAYQYFEYVCNTGCGYGGIKIYTKEKGNWVVSKTIAQWTE